MPTGMGCTCIVNAARKLEGLKYKFWQLMEWLCTEDATPFAVCVHSLAKSACSASLLKNLFGDLWKFDSALICNVY